MPRSSALLPGCHPIMVGCRPVLIRTGPVMVRCRLARSGCRAVPIECGTDCAQSRRCLLGRDVTDEGTHGRFGSCKVLEFVLGSSGAGDLKVHPLGRTVGAVDRRLVPGRDIGSRARVETVDAL